MIIGAADKRNGGSGLRRTGRTPDKSRARARMLHHKRGEMKEGRMKNRGMPWLKGRGLLLLAFALGAALMYALDPQRGRRRRALVRDQVRHGGHIIEDTGRRVVGVSRDLRNRARGAAAEVRSRFRANAVDDGTLDARVRAELGRKVPVYDALTVSVYDGKVTLRGTVSPDDAEHAVSAARHVRGVADVENLLQNELE